MITYKSSIIKKYGTPVEVKRFLGDVVMHSDTTKALLGRGTRSNNNMKAFENQKEGIFLPDFNIDSGDFVYSHPHNEVYVVAGTHQEYHGSKSLSTVTNLLKCSHDMTLKGNRQYADDRGNIKNEFGEKYKNVPCYLEHISSQLRQYEPGLNPDTEHRIYTTDLTVELTDQIIMSFKNKKMTLKVVATDYMTFPNMVVIEVAKDIRK